MKKSLFTIMMLLFAVPVLFTGCTKSELGDKAINPNANLAKSTATVCGTPLVANLVEFQGTTNLGTVTVSNDATKLYVNYTVTAGDWRIKHLVLYAGPESGLPSGSVLNQDGSGLFWMYNNFPYTATYYPDVPYASEVTTYTLEVDLSTLPDCFVVVALATLDNAAGASIETWGRSQLKNNGYWLWYCKQTCEIQTCGTAYAYGGDAATCFLTLPGVTSNNWGWTNLISTAGTYNFPIYAGAGQCDITKGTQVGTLNVVYAAGAVTVTYNMNAGVTLTSTHLYIGSGKLPMKNGSFTTSPGQFTYKHDNVTGTTDTYGPYTVSLPFYIAAHAGVCWTTATAGK